MWAIHHAISTWNRYRRTLNHAIITVQRTLGVLQKFDKDPCAMCLSGVSRNSIFCVSCSSLVHKRCSGISGTLKLDPTFRCKWCIGQARPVDGRPMSEVIVGREKLEVAPSFCYLGDFLSSGGSCELASITRCRMGQIQRASAHPHRPLISRRVYNSCVMSPNLIRSSSPAKQWLSFNPPDRCVLSPPRTKSAAGQRLALGAFSVLQPSL